MNQIKKVGVYGGRLSPIQLGHEAVANTAKAENDLLVMFLGSIGEPQSLRHFFSAEQREHFIRTVYPDAVIVKIPDVRVYGTAEENNTQRVKNLDALIEEAVPGEKDITFYGGCYEDVDFFETAGKNIHILNRFDGTTPRVSATEVRDTLAGLVLTEKNHIIRRERLLERNIVNPLIVDDLLVTFEQERDKFKKI